MTYCVVSCRACGTRTKPIGQLDAAIAARRMHVGHKGVMTELVNTNQQGATRSDASDAQQQGKAA